MYVLLLFTDEQTALLTFCPPTANINTYSVYLESLMKRNYYNKMDQISSHLLSTCIASIYSLSKNYQKTLWIPIFVLAPKKHGNT